MKAEGINILMIFIRFSCQAKDLGHIMFFFVIFIF